MTLLASLATTLVVLASNALPPDDAEAERSERIRFDTGTVVELFESEKDGTSSYSIRLSDGRASGRRVADRTIGLQRATFDPLADGPPPALVPGTGSIRIVQFETQIIEEYLAELRKRGVEVHRVLARESVVASVPKSVEAQLGSLAFVRWVGSYRPDYRVEEELLRDYATGKLSGEAPYLIQVMRRGSVDKERVAIAIRAAGGEVDPITTDGFLLTADLTRAQLESIASHDSVFWIEREQGMVTMTNKAKVVSGAKQVETTAGFTGQGVRGEVADTGVLTTHPGFQSNPIILHGFAGFTATHGTKVMGIVFGDGTNKPAATGVLPDAQPIFTAADNLMANRYTTTAELLLPPYEAVFQTNSWGTGYSGPSYPSLAFQLDDIIMMYDVVTLQAMGNGGVPFGPEETWAKNVVSVGAVWHLNTTPLDDDYWAGAGSRGPAQDGRIKPDACFWYDKLITTNESGMYQNFGGTSAATPLVAGHYGLFFQMWHEEVFGNVAPGATVFASRPHSATARAFMANTSYPYDFTGQNHDFARTHQGWGMPQVFDLLNRGDGLLVVDESRPLQNLAAERFEVVVSPGQTELRATLVFTDPPGSSSSTKNTINDLTLCITSPSKVSYWGNEGLYDGNESTTGGAADSVNTTEQVWLTDPEPGVWTIYVYADAVIQDAHVETPEIDADYALVVGPVEPVSKDVGASLPAQGGPTLSFKGYLVPDSAWKFELEGAPPMSLAMFILGDGKACTPAAGGTLVPEPDFLFRRMTSASGGASLEGDYLGGLSSGTKLYAQVWIYDPVGPTRFTASNALEFRVP